MLEPITGAQLAAGELQITTTDSWKLIPELNDGSVDYYADGQQVGSIQIGENEEKLVLVINGWLKGIRDIERVIPANQWQMLDSNGDALTNIGDSGFVILQNDNGDNLAIVSQDGETAVQVVLAANHKANVYNNTDHLPVGVDTVLDSRPIPSTGPLKDLKLAICNLYTENNNLYIEIPGTMENFQQSFWDNDGEPITMPYSGNLFLPEQY